jgi:hypothetical protein
VSYCYKGIKKTFVEDGIVGPPHLVTGNKMRFEQVTNVLDFLFL